ncbi:MAG: S-adenosylmethionine decarboxylase proenzyme, partial [bacterium]|nr:S-adenosylmethionine decarboxylase proenzyme [bacterium]
MKTIGRHLIAEFYGCNRRLLDDVDRIEQHMLA